MPQLSGMLRNSKILYDGHISTNNFQKILLSVGGSLACILDPTRDDLVATLGETMGKPALKYIKDKMALSDEGLQILEDRPIINSKTVNFKYLYNLPVGTLGHSYATWYRLNNVSPDTRKPVHFVDDADLSYIIRRYRDIHDLSHTVLGMPTNMLGEVCVKWVEAIQTGLPMCILAALFGPVRFTPKQTKLYIDKYLSWAVDCGYNANFLMSVYYEKYWEMSLEDFRNKLHILRPPII